MSKGKRTLQDMMQPPAAIPAVEAPAPAPARQPAGERRETPVPVQLYMTIDDRERLKDLARDTRTSVQGLMREAMNLLLQQHGLPPLEHARANIPSGLRK